MKSKVFRQNSGFSYLVKGIPSVRMPWTTAASVTATALSSSTSTDFVLKSTPPGRKASLSSGRTTLVYGRHIILIPSQQLGHTGAWNATLQQ